MEISIRPIVQQECEIIASWEYPKDYQWTVLGKGSENEAYLLSEKHREDHYFAIYDGGNLAGYFSLNDSIRKEFGALSLLIRPDLCSSEEEKAILSCVEGFILCSYPECLYLNVICYDYQTHAMEIYESLGYDNRGPVRSQGHDMQTYEQEGFDTDENGLRKEITLYILSKKVR